MSALQNTGYKIGGSGRGLNPQRAKFPVVASSATALFLVTDPSSLSSEETVLETAAVNDGWTVEKMQFADFTANSQADGKIVVAFWRGNSSAIKNLIFNYAVPVINMEFGFGSSWKFGAGASRSTNDFSEIDIITAGHPITAGLALGDTAIFSNTGKLNGVSTPGAGAVILAQIIAADPAEPGRPVLISYETGSIMKDGFVAPARRVSFFVSTSGLINAAGENLFQKSLAWANGDI